MGSYSTYEFAKAQECSESNPDKIHYDKDAAFRNQDYRHVLHQDGTIGTFTVRLLEASNLSRRYWSALALGPMKHLGLSKAHGGVSSFVSFCIDSTATSRYKESDFDKKIPAKNDFDSDLEGFLGFISPVVPSNNNPVWANCQFEIPLKKGALQDGQPVRLALRVDEDATLLENIIPGIAPAGGAARLLGRGYLDVTSLCLGQNLTTGRPINGVIDTWVPIRHPDEQEQCGSINEDLLLHKKVAGGEFDKKKASTADIKEGDTEFDLKAMGARVRVLITYNPHGMEPQRNDVVALEAFARQNSRTATCYSIVPPLVPLHVMEVSDSWLLVKYWVPYETNHHMFRDYHEAEGPESNESRKACIRIHRNAVFVIERVNFLDGALNIALQPAELVLNTGLGRGAREALGPLLVASKQLLMPALLSSKLLWMAVRTTALAGFTGMSAARSALVNEGTSSLTNEGQSDNGRRVRYI